MEQTEHHQAQLGTWRWPSPSFPRAREVENPPRRINALQAQPCWTVWVPPSGVQNFHPHAPHPSKLGVTGPSFSCLFYLRGRNVELSESVFLKLCQHLPQITHWKHDAAEATKPRVLTLVYQKELDRFLHCLCWAAPSCHTKSPRETPSYGWRAASSTPSRVEYHRGRVG